MMVCLVHDWNSVVHLLNFQPHECKVLIDKIKLCASDTELLDELSQIKCWTYGKVCCIDVDNW